MEMKMEHSLKKMLAFLSTNVPATFPSEIERHDLFSIIVLTT